jgi:hypothetical protein
VSGVGERNKGWRRRVQGGEGGILDSH